MLHIDAHQFDYSSIKKEPIFSLTQSTLLDATTQVIDSKGTILIDQPGGDMKFHL